MKAALKDIKPNPFRNLPDYPIDQRKLDKLKDSIERTSFWDNIVARKNGDGYQIAYGHHRMRALEDLYSPDHMVGLIVRDLSDADMLRIMAAENDDIYDMNPAVINETVRAARGFLRDHPEEVANRAVRGRDAGRSDEVRMLHVFLGWSCNRIQFAITQLDHEHREILESLPTQRHAEHFRKMVDKYDLPDEQLHEIADEINEECGVTVDRRKEGGKRSSGGYRNVAEKFQRAAVVQMQGESKKEAQAQTLEDFFRKTARKIRSLKTDLDQLLEIRQEFGDAVYVGSLERAELSNEMNQLVVRLQQLGGQHGEEERASAYLSEDC